MSAHRRKVKMMENAMMSCNVSAEYPQHLHDHTIVPLELPYQQMIILEWFAYWNPNIYPC